MTMTAQKETSLMLDADRQMEQRASRAKELLQKRYSGMRRKQEKKQSRKMTLEKRMAGLDESQKRNLRTALAREENRADKECRKRATTADFESLAVIGRGAFGEVRLVRRRPGGGGGGGSSGGKKDVSSGQQRIYALKSMEKKTMVRKNQVHHVKAEREALSLADDSYRWLTHLHYSFQDETTLYMVMEFMPGGDLMGLLIKEDTFSEDVTKFFMAEAAHAICAVHAMGYCHRDIKPDNMLLDASGHLRLTDLGLCKKVGPIQPEESPEVVLRTAMGGGGTSRQDDLAPASPTSVVGGSILGSIGDEMQSQLNKKAPPEAAQRRELARSTVGTPDYIAPEVLAAQNGESGHQYDSSVDWWSLGVIMYECLVGYTPFYAEDPVRTCRKILKWRETLRIPSDTRKSLSKECIDFLSCLIAEPGRRIGSTTAADGSGRTSGVKNGFKQIVNHPWFEGFDWARLGEGRGPLLPRGAEDFPSLLEQLSTVDKRHPRFERIMERVTCNFETFEEYGNTALDEPGGSSSRRRKKVDLHSLDEFYDYQYTRGRTPRVPAPESLDCLRDSQVANRMAELKV